MAGAATKPIGEMNLESGKQRMREFIRDHLQPINMTLSGDVARPEIFNGNYSINADNVRDNALRFLVSPCIQGEWGHGLPPGTTGTKPNNKNIFGFSFSVPPADIPRKGEYEREAREMLENHYALTPLDRPLTQESVTRLTHGALQQIGHDYPEEFGLNRPLINGIRGTFRTQLRVPRPHVRDQEQFEETDKVKYGYSVLVILHAGNDYQERGERYIMAPAEKVLTINTLEPDTASAIRAQIEEVLKHEGYSDHNMNHSPKTGNEGNKAIPKEWIDTKKIKLHHHLNEPSQIALVSRTERRPRIELSTRTQDRREAEARFDTLINDILPRYMPGGDLENAPITLKGLGKHFPQESRSHEKSPPDIRDLKWPDGTVAMTLFTPAVNPSRSGAVGSIRIGPPGSQGYLARTFQFPLNTSDPDLAKTRMRRIQGVAEAGITHYLDQHFDHEAGQPLRVFVTEDKVIDKGQHIKIFKLGDPNEPLPEGQVFLRPEIEKILSPLVEEYNRYIDWKTRVEKETDERGDRSQITCEMRRNEKETIPGKFNQNFVFYAPDEKTAEAFVARLEDNLAHQWFLNRDRPVEHFGGGSRDLVILEGLRDTMKAFPQVELPTNYVLRILSERAEAERQRGRP